MTKHNPPAEYVPDDGHAGRGSARGLSFVLLVALAFAAFTVGVRWALAW